MRSNLLLVVIAAVRASAGVSLVPGEELFLFGGRSSSVPLTIRNNEAEKQTQPLEWRLYQSSSATISPAGQRASLGEREFPARQDSVIRIALEPPEVRAITKFLVRCGPMEMSSVKFGSRFAQPICFPN